MYFKYQSFVSDVCYVYLLPICGLFFSFLLFPVSLFLAFFFFFAVLMSCNLITLKVCPFLYLVQVCP